MRGTPLREGLLYFWRMPFLRTTIGMVAASNVAAAGVPVAVIILAIGRACPAQRSAASSPSKA